MSALLGKRILLGVTGGIAAYKSPELVREFVRQGAEVHVILTESAARFVTPLTLEVVSGNPVGTSLWNMQDNGEHKEIHHTEAGRHADLIVVAPATAHFLARTACGLASDLLDNILLASTSPVLIAPSMNVLMHENPIVEGHRKTLENMERFTLMEPDEGHLACNVQGKGRLPAAVDIAKAASSLLLPGDLAGCRMVITAGPTQEALDPARFLSNPSTGKMGFALAASARKRGADVTLIHGPVHLAPLAGVRSLSVRRAVEMHEAVVRAIADADVLIMAAAVADWTPKNTSTEKEAKHSEERSVTFVRTLDILRETQSLGPAIRVGFAAQTHDLRENALRKLKNKGLDLIVANPIGTPDAGFGSDSNQGIILGKDGSEETLPPMSKESFAERILDAIERRRGGKDVG